MVLPASRCVPGLYRPLKSPGISIVRSPREFLDANDVQLLSRYSSLLSTRNKVKKRKKKKEVEKEEKNGRNEREEEDEEEEREGMQKVKQSFRK